MALTAVFAVSRMRIDIFPDLDLPVIYVAQPYGGMSPAQMEGYITYYYEYHFLYINGIESVESKSIQNTSLLKLTFHPGTDMAEALAQTVGYVNRARAFMPPGTVGPFIMRFDAGTVPVGYLVFSSRQPQPRRDSGSRAQPRPPAVRDARRPDVAAAVRRQPADHRRPRRSRPAARVRHVARRSDPRGDGRQRHHAVGQRQRRRPDADLADELGRHERRTSCSRCRSASAPGRRCSCATSASVSDSTDIPTAYALVNGRRAVYIPVTKRPDASTLAVVNEVKANLPRFQALVPDDITVSYELDQSGNVSGALQSRAARSGPRRAADRR